MANHHSHSSKLRIILIVQARMGSTRLPGKIFKEILEKPLLAYELERLRKVKKANTIVIATTNKPIDNAVVDFCHMEQVPLFRGSEDDVLDRYYQAAKSFDADVVVRVTGDCPLIDPKIIDETIDFYLKTYPNYDYVTNTLERTYPRGLDVEVFSFDALKKAAQDATLPAEREHVTPYIYTHPDLFSLGNITLTPNESHHRWTVDTEEDFLLISHILTALYPTNPDFHMHDVLNLLKQHPEWIRINANIKQKAL